MRGHRGSIFKQQQALTDVAEILKNNCTSARNTWEHSSGQLSSNPLFPNSTPFAQLSYQIPTEQTIKCAEYNL